MTQVGSIMPEGAVTLTPTPTVTPTPVNVSADAVSTATASAVVQAAQLLKAASKDQQNGEKISEVSEADAGGSTPVVQGAPVAASAADGVEDTEEDDSQITSSSTENGADRAGGGVVGGSGDARVDGAAVDGAANGADDGDDMDDAKPNSPAAALTSTTADNMKESSGTEVAEASATTVAAAAVCAAKAKEVDAPAKPVKPAAVGVESSTSSPTSNACDGAKQAVDPACNVEPKSSSVVAAKGADAKDNDEGVSSTSDSQPKQLEKPSTNSCDKIVANSVQKDATTPAPEEEVTSNAATPRTSDDMPMDTKNTIVHHPCGDDAEAVSGDELMDTAENPLAIDETVPQVFVAAQRENGSASVAEKARNESAVVDLDSDDEMDEDDDDDDDDDEEEEEMVPKAKQQESASHSSGDGAKSNGDSSKLIAHQPPDSTHKSRSLCSDSDGAVVIGSDSENEAVAHVPSPKIPIQKPVPHFIDDDDDDCVVIEDDTPAPMASDLTKRKSLAMDSANNSDDSQPPTKRQRNAAQHSANQITIKDARSLMPQELAMKKASDGNIYPINITPASNMVLPGPPKLVPMSSATNMGMGLAQGLAPVMTGLPPGMGVMPTLGTNSNLLPGLTDDMFVLEAPSFIVPYIYEKPPADSLREIVKEIETKYKLSREDLAEADRPDEFDMMTEQNKEDKEDKDEKEDKNGKKKNKRRRGNDQDDSWSEESDDDDDDDDDEDSESGMRTKVLIKEASDDLSAIKGAIKPAAAVTQSPMAGGAKPGQENYFESPLGKFFMDIGVGLVQEYVQCDLIRLQKRKMRKSLGKNISEFERAITALSGNLEASRKKNSTFKFTLKRCEFCQFKSESALAMANHYETPHMNGLLYRCNFCPYEIRSNTEIVYHMEAVHNIKARLVKPLPYHQCPNCGFEDNGKAKLARHQPVCVKKFRPELNLAPPADWEAPAKIPRIKPRHGLVGTATAYQAMAAQAAAQKAALASIQHQQQQVAQARSLQAAALAVQNAANKIRGRPPVVAKPGPVPMANTVVRGTNQVRSPMPNNVVMSNNYQLAGGQIVQTANAMVKKTLTGQPSISITPLPRQTAAPPAPTPSTSKMPPAGMKPGQNPTGTSKAQFVICEICDGYIKDLEQLRNHMQWMHKVKIHPKMIFNRPPLNCQKCQFRFFTDQGLERHLLGSHGLVTSSMQEAANKAKDGGRCPVCGRMYQWKLLNHVSRDHHMTLKPAHLSYKCTVCTATFGMYKQFETHVYTAHSTVAKKAMDGKKNAAAVAAGSAATSGGPQQLQQQQRNSLSASNDSLLKPLKINDEITIIPQPSSKPRITNTESHVID